MKRTLMILTLAFISLTAGAQYNNSAELYKKKGKLYQGDVRLNKEQISKVLSPYSDDKGISYNDLWEKADGMRTAGVVLTSVGSVSVVAGPVMFLSGMVLTLATGLGSAISGDPEELKGSGLLTSGAVISGLGVAMLGSGIPLLCVGNKRMKNIVSGYNSYASPAAPDLTLAFGPCPSGLGLSLRF